MALRLLAHLKVVDDIPCPDTNIRCRRWIVIVPQETELKVNLHYRSTLWLRIQQDLLRNVPNPRDLEDKV